MEIYSAPIKKPEYGLIILGNAGVGKSYICNTIIGYERFKTDYRREAVTTVAECHRIDAGTSDLLIYNMPGLVESRQEEIDRNKSEIIKAFERSPKSVVMFVWTQVNGRPQPDDIIAFKALQKAYKFPLKSLLFVLNNIPSERPPTYEARFFALLKKMLNPMPVSLEEMFFLNTLDPEDTEKFDAARNQLLHFIAEHHENEHRMQAAIIVQSIELRMLRKALKEQCLEAETNKQTFELLIKQIREEYEATRRAQEKRYQAMVLYLEIAKQQEAAAVEEQAHGHAYIDVEVAILDKEKKVGIKERCQQIRKKVEEEKGMCKKVGRTYQIAKDELLIKCKSNDDEHKDSKTRDHTIGIESERKERVHGGQLNKIQKKFNELCNNKCDPNLPSPVVGGALGATSVSAVGAVAGGVVGAVAGGAVGAVAGGVVGGAAGVILGPCAIATAAGGAATGAAVGVVAGAVAGAAIGGTTGVTIGGSSGAIITLYRCRKR